MHLGSVEKREDKSCDVSKEIAEKVAMFQIFPRHSQLSHNATGLCIHDWVNSVGRCAPIQESNDFNVLTVT